MFRKIRKRPNRRTTRSLLGFETLETRLTPAVVFQHQFGNETTVDEGGDKLDAAPVFLLFWGNYWNQGTGAQERSQIIDGIRNTLNGPYLSGLAQYGVDWHAHFVNAVQVDQDPPNNFENGDLRDIIRDTIAYQTSDPALYFPRPSSVAGDPLYLAITPPGIESENSNADGYHTASFQFFSLTDIELEAIGVAETGTDGSFLSVVDQATAVLTHEIFEAITDPFSAYEDLDPLLPFFDTTAGIRTNPGAGWTLGGSREIGDFESNFYSYRLNGTLVQAYWSQQDSASIVADGNIQRFTLTPHWNGSSFTGKSRLTIQGDQFAAGYDDKVSITTVNVNGVENIRVTMNGETALFEVDKLGPPAIFGDSTDAIVIQLGGGDNHVDLTGYTSSLQIRVEQQTPPLISIEDLTMAEESASAVTVNIASIITGNRSGVTETHPAVSVDYSTPASGGGTASPLEFTVLYDYLLHDHLTIASHDMRELIYVVAAADTQMERDETFVIQLKNAVGGKIVDDTGIVTIVDDDLVPTFVMPTGPFDINWDGDGRLVDLVPDSIPLRNFGTAVSGSAIDSNGRLVVLGGEIVTGSDDNAIKLTRYLPNGERDLNFDNDGLVSLRLANQSIFTVVSGIAIYRSGPNRDKILVAGKYDVGGTSNSFVARFGIDGSLDTTFGAGRGYIDVDYGTFPETTPFDHAFDIAIYESGPYAGEFVLVGANENGRASSTEVSRHKADGSLDSTFGNGGKLNFRLQYSDNHGGTDNTFMSRVLIDANEKILLGGYAGVPGTYNGTYDTRTVAGALVRLNSNGSLDTTFGIQGAAFCNVEQGDGQGISDIAIQADGKILATVAGDGFYFGGRLVRFNQNGELDQSLAPVAATGYSPGQTVLKSVAVGSDGAVYVGGYATPIGASGFGDFVVGRYQQVGGTLVLDSGFDVTEHDGAITLPPSGRGVVSLVNGPDGGVFASGRGYDSQQKLAFVTSKLESAGSDLSVTMSSAIAETGQVSYTIQVRNSGSDAIFASLRDTLPANARLVSTSVPDGWVTSPIGTTGNVDLTVRNLKQSDGIQTVVLTVDFDGVGAPGSVVNRVDASSANLDPNSSNNTAFTTDDLRQNLSIDVGTSRVDAVTAGTNVSYILDVWNQGQVASRYQVSTTLPLNSTFVSATGDYTLIGQTVTWTETSLGAGAHRSRLLTVRATASGYLVDQATVTGQFADATPLDNTASSYTTDSLGFAPFSGLVSYYRAEGNTNDFTGAHPALNSTIIGYGEGHTGSGFVFNGTNTSVDLGTWFTGNAFQSFTMNLWVKPAGQQQTYADIFDNNHPSNFVFQQNENSLNQYVWGVYDGNSGNPFATLATNQWQLLTVTRDNATLKDKIYVNGNQVGEMTATGPINYSNSFLRLGSWGGGGRNWRGSMDDVSIFSRALTPAEIQQLVNADMGVANQPPTISSSLPTLVVQQGQQAVMQGLVNDPDGFDSRLLLTASIGTVRISAAQPGYFEWSLDTTGLPAQTTTVTITVNDGDGGIRTTSFNLEIQNIAPPQFDPILPIVIEGNLAGGAMVNIPLPNATSNGGGTVTVTGPSGQAFYPVGTTQLTWTATDSGGRSTTATSSVNVVDTIAPTIITPAPIIVEATGNGQAIVTLPSATATDIVGPVSITSPSNGAYPFGKTTVTWIAQDAAGNSASASSYVQVVDTIAPILVTNATTISLEATSSTGADYLVTLPFAHDSGGPVTVTGPSGLLHFGLGTTMLTWTATDQAGNTAQASTSIQVLDTTPPIIISPDPIIVEATGNGQAIVTLPSATATDIVGPVSITSPSNGAYPFGKTTVTWIAQDAAGNSASASSYVQVVDTTAPTLVPNASTISLEATSSTGADYLVTLPFAHDSGGPVTVTGPSGLLHFGLGTTVLTWTATDQAGNTAQASTSVHVLDTTPPIIIAPDPIIVEATGNGQAIVTLPPATATDIVGPVSITSPSNGAYPFGKTTVTWIAQDAAGNSASASSYVQVVDTIAPILVTNATTISLEATSSTGADYLVTLPFAHDSGGPVTVTGPSGLLHFGLGTTVLTWTATDQAGNTAQVHTSVNVLDTTPPVIVAPADVTVNPYDYLGADVTLANATASDIVGVASITGASGTHHYPVGTTILTWTATDLAGNTASSTSKVTVLAPSISVEFSDTAISERGGVTQFIITRNFIAPIVLLNAYTGPVGTQGLRGSLSNLPAMAEGVTLVSVPYTAVDDSIVNGDFIEGGYAVIAKFNAVNQSLSSDNAFIKILDDEFLQVESVVVNGKQSAPVSSFEVSQRSRVLDLTVTFNGMASVAPGAFVLTRYKTFDASNRLVGDASNVGLVQTITTINTGTSNPKTQVVLRFTGAFTEFGSLSDGLYRLTINSSSVKDVPLIAAPRQLDGDLDNVAGGNYANDSFFRLFGDSDGNGVVDAFDNSRFRDYALRTNRPGVADWYRWYFDFDDSLTLDAAGNRTAYNAIDGTEFNKRLSKRRTV